MNGRQTSLSNDFVDNHQTVHFLPLITKQFTQQTFQQKQYIHVSKKQRKPAQVRSNIASILIQFPIA